jgi:hypothetical protein
MTVQSLGTPFHQHKQIGRDAHGKKKKERKK